MNNPQSISQIDKCVNVYVACAEQSSGKGEEMT